MALSKYSSKQSDRTIKHVDYEDVFDINIIKAQLYVCKTF